MSCCEIKKWSERGASPRRNRHAVLHVDTVGRGTKAGPKITLRGPQKHTTRIGKSK